jgi:hypothetical protein
MITTDLTKAYYSVPIAPSASPFLAVKHRGDYYIPRVLPFGHSLAPYVFNKIVRNIVAISRLVGMRVYNFYDDFLWATQPESAKDMGTWVAWILPRLGWKTNAKCTWIPATIAEFVGFQIDTKQYTVRALERRIKKTEDTLTNMKGKGETDLHEVQSLAGQLQSMTLAIPAAPVFSRGLYDSIRNAGTEEGGIKLSVEAMEEVMFWTQNLRQMNGAPIRNRAETININVDASATGIGAIMEGKTFAEALPERMVDTSSTERELWTVLRVFQEWGEALRGQHVKIITDSLPAARNLIKGGGPVTSLCNIIKQIYKETKQNEITYVVTWVEREQNTQADILSKEWAEWYRLTPEAMQKLRKLLDRDGHKKWRY